LTKATIPMNIKCVLTGGCLLLLSLSGTSQRINLEGHTPHPLCAGAVVSVSFTTSGTFEAGNTFRVRLRSESGWRFTDLPGSFTSSPASVTLPATLPAGSYNFFVESTKPVVANNSVYSFTIYTPPSALLTGNSASGAIMNPHQAVNLRTTLTGGAPYTLTLGDGSRLRMPTDYSELTVYPARSTTYTVGSVENTCGTKPGSGSTTVTVNDLGFSIPAREDALPCLGEVLPIHYSASGPLPPNTTFEAEVVDGYTGQRLVTLPVSGTASPLQLRLPATPLSNFGYKIRVYARNGTLSAWYQDGQAVVVRRAPRLALSGPATPMPFGGITTLTVSYTGVESGRIVFSDGQTLSYSEYNQPVGSVSRTVSPSATTSYSIVAFQGSCPQSVTLVNTTARVEVKPGIQFERLSANSVCGGEVVTLYYTASPGYTLPPGLKVRFSDHYQWSDAAVSRPGELTFVAPPAPRLLWRVGIEVFLPNLTERLLQTPPIFSTRVRPTLRLEPRNDSINQPEVRYLSGQLTAGGTTTVVFSNGERGMVYENSTIFYTNQGPVNLILFVARTTSFSVATVSNDCGVGQVLPGAVVVRVRSAAQPGIRIQPIALGAPRYCPGERAEIRFSTIGTFGADNQFRLELSQNGTYVALPTTQQAGSLTFDWPPGWNDRLWVRVTATSPLLHSEAIELYGPGLHRANGILTLATTNAISGASALTVAPGHGVVAEYRFNLGYPPFSYTLLNGEQGRADGSFQRTYFPAQPATYGFASVADRCGTLGTSSGQTRIVVASPVLITGEVARMVGSSSARFCAQRPVLVPFVRFDTPPASVSYVVQVSEDLRAWNTLPASGTSSPLMVQLPTTLAAKSVYYRVAQVAGSDLIVGERAPSLLRIDAPPGLITLSGPNALTLVELPPDGAVTLVATNAPSETHLTLSSGEHTQTAYANYNATAAFHITQPGVYSLVAATNRCGYGQMQGAIRVVMKPHLVRAMVSKQSYCANEPISATYVMGGHYDATNRFMLYADDMARQTSQLLTEASTQTLAVSLSVGLPAGQYTLRVVSSAPSATITAGTPLIVQTPLSASVVSQTLAIYSGDEAGMEINTSTGLPYSVSLSNGQIEQVVSSRQSIPLLFQTGLTSYSVTRAQNSCGTLQPTGVVSVSVLPTAGVQLRVQTLYQGGTNTQLICTGKLLTVLTDATGTFGPANRFTLLMSDATGNNYQPIGSGTSVQSVTAAIPASTVAGGGYRFRLVSSHPIHEGATSKPYLIRASPTGVLTGSASILKGDSARLTVVLTGKAPWQVLITNSTWYDVHWVQQSPFTVTVRPDSTFGYRLYGVSDSQCGAGTATGTARITVAQLLATDLPPQQELQVYPNPTTGQLHLAGPWASPAPTEVRLYSPTGLLLQRLSVQPQQGKLRVQLDAGTVPPGLFFLLVDDGSQQQWLRAMKQ
jgi:hypothetical protein